MLPPNSTGLYELAAFQVPVFADVLSLFDQLWLNPVLG